jgi:hypothetical protein
MTVSIYTNLVSDGSEAGSDARYAKHAVVEGSFEIMKEENTAFKYSLVYSINILTDT